MATPDDALKGFYARASQNAALKTLLGTKPGIASAPADIHEGWVPEKLKESDLPRMTYFGVAPSTRRPGIYSVRIQTDGWFTWEAGGAAERQSWTNAMLELFDEAHWSYGTARLYATVINPGRDYPAPPGTPLRRQMDIRIEVSDGPVI